ncbi:hypothetical protein SeLEV6574_g06927 [Synchytrium endobioticum]|uniref:Uncharacterized protein n=1 Tax=Synchytrium endobioticum TaxID=286115 RepID=A0A507CFQ0_9FUNG|nr:hypothetical protein SeLEV6574_g06927 [Synchytrium endobioticum]
MSVMEATDFGNEVVGDLGGASLPQAHLTEEQLLQGIWLLRERRSQLAQRALKWECDKLDSIIRTRLKSDEFMAGVVADQIWRDSVLKLMLPCVIPDEVGLTLADLMAKPTGVDLKMLAYHWEALENLMEPLRLSGHQVPRLEKLQRHYTVRIMAIAGRAAFGKKEPPGRRDLLVPETTSAAIHNPVSTPTVHYAASRVESVLPHRRLSGSSGGVGTSRSICSS